MKLEASKVWDGLWVGSAPAELAEFSGFSMVVLCAEEYQPELSRFPGKILRPAFRDTHDTLTQDERDRIDHAANAVAKEITAGGRCLVTCQAGLNRSALVAALAMLSFTKLSADEVITTIRINRKPYPNMGEQALYNTQFIRIIKNASR